MLTASSGAFTLVNDTGNIYHRARQLPAEDPKV